MDRHGVKDDHLFKEITMWMLNLELAEGQCFFGGLLLVCVSALLLAQWLEGFLTTEGKGNERKSNFVTQGRAANQRR